MSGAHPRCKERHTCQQPSGRGCIEQGCTEPAGTLWGPYWCPDHAWPADGRLEPVVNRPLHVFKENGHWLWGCRLCNWVSPQPLPFLTVAFTRAEMHHDTWHAGPFTRSSRWTL